MEELKSLHPFKCVLTLTFLMTIIIMYTGGVGFSIPSDGLSYKKIIDDLPVEKDFPPYFMALKNAIDFCLKHKHYVDVNLQFGLFLIDMNLRQFLQQERPKIPNGTRSRMEKLFVQIDELADYYRSMVQKNKNDTKIGPNMKLALLFYDTWPEPPEAFNTEMLNRTRILSRAELATIYDTWGNYHYNVFNVEDNRPTPAEADECIVLLVQNDLLHFIGRSQPTCVMGPRCKQVVLGDNEYGYGLTHRLLLMIIARFSNKCVVFSAKTDKLKMDVFCKKCFNEAEYIAYNDFHLPDLMFEQISLCGLLGHAQFIRKHWLKTLLGFQTKVGCFSEKLATGDFQENRLKKEANREWNIERPSDIIYGQCNGHFSAVAMATLSHALRYIIETYY